MEEEDEDSIPLPDRRVSGAGIKRKRVASVPAASRLTSPPASTNTNVGDHYLSIVFPSKGTVRAKDGQEISNSSESFTPSSLVRVDSPETRSKDLVCEICDLPIQETESTGVNFKPHQATIAHQVCLPHSFPPSHLDRKRHGLKYLSSYGWDPDGRLGLGATGEGIRAPIKVKIKNDNMGLGVKRLERFAVAKGSTAKVQKLDAKQVRIQELEAKRKAAKLQELFYRRDDVERYLGSS